MRLILFFFLLLTQQSFGQTNLQLLSHVTFDSATLAGCWHYVDDTGREYALVGTSKGLTIVDLTIPTTPVKKFNIPSLVNNWREVKTYGKYAYFGSEAVGSGITIVDLSQLPDTIYWKKWFGDGAYENMVQKSHTVQAQDGYLYILGGGNVTDGATIADISDPWNPHIVGKYSSQYVHDAFIRNDTMWTSEIYAGQFGVVDVSDKANPVLMANHPTPAAFNHNTWLSADGKVLFTTDEKSGAPMASFDVSDLSNIQLLDKYYPSNNPAREVHNVRGIRNFLVNPSYGGQLTIVDATRPHNLVETAIAVVGTSLVWDADPYLPSGIIFASAKNEGLFVFQPVWQRAAYLEGAITDAVTGQPINKAFINISTLNLIDSSAANGTYATGHHQEGAYDVTCSAQGYVSKTIPGVLLQNGEVTVLNVALDPIQTGTESIENKLFHISPTVVQAGFNIYGDPLYLKDLTLQLIDLQGKVLLEQSGIPGMQWVELPEGLSSNIYLVRLLNKDGSLAGLSRIVKE